MKKRTPGHITVYDDGVMIYLGIAKESDSLEIEINTACAFVLASELLEHARALDKTITMTKERKG